MVDKEPTRADLEAEVLDITRALERAKRKLRKMLGLRFSQAFAQKVWLHRYMNGLSFGALHVIDTKHGHSKRLITKHRVHQMGYDFGLPSTTYLEKAYQRANDVVWLDYCCTPYRSFVQRDLRLCKTKWVFCTFSVRCKWRSRIKAVCRGTAYKMKWVYYYTDTCPMIVVCYSRSSKSPKALKNPVGKRYAFSYKGVVYERTCKKLLLGPSDDPDELYLEFKDSNEPMYNCKRI